MNLGYRIFDDAYIDKFDLDLVQIGVWHNREEDFQRVRQLAQRLRQMGKRFVIHPSSLYLSETRTKERKYYLTALKKYAHISDLGLIIHDETLLWGDRLEGRWEDAFKSALAKLEKICPVSLENANNSNDVIWFWKKFANSITFDIGHFEAAGVDCFEIIDGLTEDLIRKLNFVHLHRNNGRKDIGITDHWPLVDGCSELKIVNKLQSLKPEVKVILEVDGEVDIKRSLEVINPMV